MTHLPGQIRYVSIPAKETPNATNTITPYRTQKPFGAHPSLTPDKMGKIRTSSPDSESVTRPTREWMTSQLNQKEVLTLGQLNNLLV